MTWRHGAELKGKPPSHNSPGAQNRRSSRVLILPGGVCGGGVMQPLKSPLKPGAAQTQRGERRKSSPGSGAECGGGGGVGGKGADLVLLGAGVTDGGGAEVFCGVLCGGEAEALAEGAEHRHRRRVEHAHHKARRRLHRLGLGHRHTRADAATGRARRRIHRHRDRHARPRTYKRKAWCARERSRETRKEVG